MNLDRSFSLAYEVNQRIAEVRLNPIEWQCLMQISDHGLRSGQLLCQSLSISPDGLAIILEKMMRLGLVQEPEFSLSEYMTFVDKYKTAKEETPQKIEPTPAPKKSVSFSIQRTAQRPDLEAKSKPIDILPLRPVLDFIRQKTSSGTVGQLAIYRVFLQLPRHLVEASGLQDVDLDHTDIVLTDPELIRSFLHAVKDVVGSEFKAA